MSNLREHYKKEVVPKLMDSRKYGNRHQVPKVEKVVINMGVKADLGKEAVEDARTELGMITGQRPLVTLAKKAISNFKLREGQPVGCKVTLRGERMYEFLERFIGTALPRQRDFRGVSAKSFDGRGSYSIGISDQTIFPEIELDKIKRQQGMDITIVTTANTNDEAKELLKLMGMPFAN
ncbi:MAG: 50S ribosomal protein L5 [Verrucomicrobiae bacterium]|nr:50S ribosomal protein L5 [Verrucomicrobiae bacterium]